VWIYVQGYEGAGDTFATPRDTAVVRSLFASVPYTLTWRITNSQGVETHFVRPITATPLDTQQVRIAF
jgi:hypothetical protein